MPLQADVQYVSVDDHLLEPPDLWTARLPARWRDAAPRVVETDEPLLGEFGQPVAAGSEAWLFDGTTFWTFDDPLVLLQKTLYIRTHGLGGAMMWELSGDDANATLTRTIHFGLNVG